MRNLRERVGTVIKTMSNIHRPGDSPDIYLFATPRGGSTWLMELIWSQPGLKYCSEPLNIRNPRVEQCLGLHSWAQLYSAAASEHYQRYFSQIAAGQIRFLNPNPFRRHSRLWTNRIVFKIIHAGHDRMELFEQRLGGRILYVLRHPIAVGLSREVLPMLDDFLVSELRDAFSAEQVRLAEKIIGGGSQLERGVLAWCLQNAIPLKNLRPSWLVVTYEQLIVQPEVVIEQICRRLDLPQPQRMLRALAIPSAVIGKSDAATQELLKKSARGTGRERLIEKWRDRVSDREEAELMDILSVFGLDIYRQGSHLPDERFFLSATDTS